MKNKEQYAKWKIWRHKDRFEKPEKHCFQTTKYRAKKKGLEFNIDLGDIVFPENCPILGIPIFLTVGKKSSNSPSVDRIDPSKGYVKGNVRVISDKANSHKSDMTIADVERLLRYMKNI